MFALIFTTFAAVGTLAGEVPVITEAFFHPNHVTAGEFTYCAARVAPGEDGAVPVRVGLFFIHEGNWMHITELKYMPDHDIFVSPIRMPREVPNGIYTFYFVATTLEGDHSEPVPRDLAVYSITEIIVAAPRGCLLSEDVGAVKNFHRGDANDKLPIERGIDVPLGTHLIFQSRYDGVWYEEGSGNMGTTLRLWAAGEEEGEWILVGEETYRSDTLEGPALRPGVAQVSFRALKPGPVLMRLAVASFVHPMGQEEPLTDIDDVTFVINVIR